MPHSIHPKLLIALTLAAAALSAQNLLQITSPANGVKVVPGQNITVNVRVSSGTQLKGGLVALAPPEPLTVTPAISGPPYQFSLQIPAAIALRPYEITAFGALLNDQLVVSPPIVIDVERTDVPTSLAVKPASLNYMPIGDRSPLLLTATYSDGATLDVTHSTLSSYKPKTTGIVTIDSDGVVTAEHSGQTNITVTNAGVPAFLIPVTVNSGVSIANGPSALYPFQIRKLGVIAEDAAYGPFRWTISPEGFGSVIETGSETANYTAPMVNAQNVLTVTATSVHDPIRTATTQLTLYPPLSIAISPATTTLSASRALQFGYKVLNDMFYNPQFPQVQWSIRPSIGFIDVDGRYTAPASIAADTVVTVTGTSITDRTKSASAVVKLMASH